MMDPNAFMTVQQMAGGYCLSRCLHVVAELGVADALGDTPRTAAELAAAAGANADALGRVLRLLAANGVFEVAGTAVSHSPASRLLRTDHPQSMRDFVRMFGLAINWAAYGELEYSVRTGLSAGERVIPGGLWAHFAQDPKESGIFNAAMEAKARGQVPRIVASYDFSRFGVIGDIGGGHGHLLRAVLDAAPNAKGVLFDQ